MKEVADGSFRGAVVMVARKGKLVYHEAVGMQTPSTPMSEDTVFRIYSMTKPLVSVAAMMLVEDGRIQLTDPVGKFLPGFDKMQVSVATKTPEGVSYSMAPSEEIEKLAAVPLAFQPGTTWHYSRSTDVLGRVVEVASGKRLGDFLQE